MTTESRKSAAPATQVEVSDASMIGMDVKRPKAASGASLVEVMVAIAVLSVAVIGASRYSYYAALDARRAAMLRTGADIALLLCESWRGVKGTETYDPTAYFASDSASSTILAISPINDDAIGPEDDSFTLLGVYTVVADSIKYYAILSWKDVSTGLRALNVNVAWPQKGQVTASVADADVSFKLTTYTSY